MDWQGFFRHQLAVWPEAAARHEALSEVQTRYIMMDRAMIRVDYNPARERSTAAKVDTASIARRACFLCADTRPAQQCAMPTDNIPELQEYDFLVNPFPILSPHFTIVSKEHRPQHLPDIAMVAAARAFPELVFFYNGAKAGASAPDHSHFQAVGMFLPTPPVRSELFTDAEEQWPEIIARCLRADGLFNLFVYQHDGRVEARFIPRRAHRPACYPELMVSPGAIDVAGHIITVRKADFDALNASILKEIYADTCFL